MDANKKQVLMVSGCLIAILMSGLWIYFTHIAVPKFNVSLHKAIGQVLAEQTVELVRTGRVALVSIPANQLPELECQIHSYKKTLRSLSPITVKEIVLETEGKEKYGVGSGLSSRRFLRLAKKCEKLQAIVSLVGAPHLSEQDLALLEPKPVLIAESRSAEELKPLFAQNVLKAAVVSRFQFPGPDIKKPGTRKEWFDTRYQVVTATNAETLP